VLEVNQKSAGNSDQSNLSFWCAGAKAACWLSACSSGSTKGRQREGNPWGDRSKKTQRAEQQFLRGAEEKWHSCSHGVMAVNTPSEKPQEGFHISVFYRCSLGLTELIIFIRDCGVMCSH